MHYDKAYTSVENLIDCWLWQPGFHSTPSGIETFKKGLSAYDGAKGSIRFPLDKPIQFELICRTVKFRVKECQLKASDKKWKTY